MQETVHVNWGDIFFLKRFTFIVNQQRKYQRPSSVKVKDSRKRPDVAQRAPGDLGSQIS